MGVQGGFLLVTWDGAGNLPPERSMIRALMARGHRVDVLAHASVRQKFAADGAHFHEYRSLKPLSSLDRIDPAIEGQNTFTHVIFARGMFEDTRSLIDEVDPDVLLIDGTLPFGLLAGRVSGLPTVALWHSLYDLVLDGPFAGVFNARLNDVNQVATANGLEPFSSYRNLLEADRVLVFSYGEGFDGSSGVPDNVVHVGPLRSVDPEATGEYRPSTDAPVVVVGLSTSYMDQQALLQKLCDVLAQLPVAALVTTGPAISPDSLTRGPNTTVTQFIAHDRILPAARLLVTHAGHGTVAAGLTYGVPMLCIPMGRDQPMVAQKVVENGLGTMIGPDASREQLRAAISALITDGETRQRSEAFAVRIRAHAGMETAIRIAEDALERT